MTMNPVSLTALLPKVRGYIYWAYAIAGLAIGATQVGYAAAEVPTPTALTVTLAVFAFLGGGLGLTAASNTPTGTEYPAEQGAGLE